MPDLPVTDEEWRDQIWQAFARHACEQGYAPKCVRAMTYPVMVPAPPESGLYMVPSPDMLGICYVISFEPGESPFVHMSSALVRSEDGDMATPEMIGEKIATGLIETRTQGIKDGRVGKKVLS